MSTAHRPWALLLLLLAGLLLLPAAPASAHAQLVGTDPGEGSVVAQAPSEVTLSFSEPVRLTARRITTYDADGEVVQSLASASGAQVTVRPGGPLPDGTYLVSWAVVSQDGHPVSGTLTFSVGSRSPVVQPPPDVPAADSAMTADRGLLASATYVGLLGAVGLVLFAAVVLPRAVAGAPRARVRRLARFGTLLAVLGAWLQVPVASAYAQGSGWAGVLATFDAGLVRNELAVAVVVTLGLGVASLALGAAAPGPVRRLVLLAGSLGAVAAPAMAGHSRSYGPGGLVLAADVTHLAAGAAWLGGLIGLVAVLGLLRHRPGEAAATLTRFSAVAAGLLLVVAGAGLLLGWRILGSWPGLVESTYGRLLLVKVALVLVAATAAGWNRWRLLPTVRAAAGTPDGGLTALRRVLAVEAGLLVGVVAVTGFLVSQPPVDLPDLPAAPEPVVETLRLGGLDVAVQLSPGGTGGNTLSVVVRDPGGETVDPPRSPRVSLRSEQFDLGTLALRRVGTGSYEALVPIPRSGEWQLQVGLRLSRFDHPVATIAFEVPDPAG